MGHIIKPNVVVLHGFTTSQSLVDGTTYYIMSQYFLTQSQGVLPLYCPVGGVLEQVDCNVNQTDGSNEGVTIEVLVNNVSVGTLLNNQALTTNLEMRTWPNVNVEVDDVLEIRIICPTWATNPTNTRFGYLYKIRM